MEISHRDYLRYAKLDLPMVDVMQTAYEDDILDGPNCNLTTKGQNLLGNYLPRLHEISQAVVRGAFLRSQHKELSHRNFVSHAIPALLLLFQDKRSALEDIALKSDPKLAIASLYAGLATYVAHYSREQNFILDTGQEMVDGRLWKIQDDNLDGIING